MKQEVHVFAETGFAAGCADRIAAALQDDLASREMATLVLAGGGTPKQIYRKLADSGRDVDWSRVHLFWGDERPVPPDHPESNYGMAAEALIRHIKIPEENVHRIRGELPPAEAANLYREEIRSFFLPPKGLPPRFDVLLLGLGEDGHVASVFPGETEGMSERLDVAAPYVKKLGLSRVTLTMRVLRNARRVMVMAAGARKARILHEVLETREGELPARLLDGSVVWFADRAAASQLTSQGNP